MAYFTYCMQAAFIVCLFLGAKSEAEKRSYGNEALRSLESGPSFEEYLSKRARDDDDKFFDVEEKRHFPGEQKRHFPGDEKRHFPGEQIVQQRRFYPGGMPPTHKRMPSTRDAERSPDVFWDSSELQKRERFLGRRNEYDERETTL